MSIRCTNSLELVAWTEDGLHLRVSGTEQQIVIDASLKLTDVRSSARAEQQPSHEVSARVRAQLVYGLWTRSPDTADRV